MGPFPTASTARIPYQGLGFRVQGLGLLIGSWDLVTRVLNKAAIAITSITPTEVLKT